MERAMGIEPKSEAWEDPVVVTDGKGTPELQEKMGQSCRHVDLELFARTAMYRPGPRIELAGDAADAWKLVSPFLSEEIL
jgi:hypothetical protein